MEERTYVFGEETITAPIDMTPEQVKSVWMNVHPQLENADIVENDDGSVSFNVHAGTKG